MAGDFRKPGDGRDEAATARGWMIGKPHRKVDAVERMRGVMRYTDDLKLPGMLHGKILRSPHAHARIRRIDASRALAMPGVFGVVTGRDFPIPYGVIPWTPDENALCVDKALLRRRRRGRGGGDRRGHGDRGVRGHRRRLRAAARDLRPGGVAGRQGRRGDQPVLEARQPVQARAPRLRRRRGRAGRGGRGGRGRVLLRGDHAHGDRAALRAGPRRAGRRADRVVGDAGVALPAPRAGQGARGAGQPHPRDPAAHRRRVRRQERAVRPRVLRGQAGHDDRAAGEDPLHARGGVLQPPRPPPDEDALQDRLRRRRAHHRGGRAHPHRRRRVLQLRAGHHLLFRTAAVRAVPASPATGSTAGAPTPTSRPAGPSAVTAACSRASPSSASSTRRRRRSASIRSSCAGATTSAPTRSRSTRCASARTASSSASRRSRRPAGGSSATASCRTAAGSAWPGRPTSAAPTTASTPTRCRRRRCR